MSIPTDIPKSLARADLADRTSAASELSRAALATSELAKAITDFAGVIINRYHNGGLSSINNDDYLELKRISDPYMLKGDHVSTFVKMYPEEFRLFGIYFLGTHIYYKECWVPKATVHTFDSVHYG